MKVKVINGHAHMNKEQPVTYIFVHIVHVFALFVY